MQGVVSSTIRTMHNVYDPSVATLHSSSPEKVGKYAPRLTSFQKAAPSSMSRASMALKIAGASATTPRAKFERPAIDRSLARPRASLGDVLPMARKMAQPPKPSICVICGPSGVGTKRMIKRLLTDNPGKFGFPVVHTTRLQRPGETNGIDYFFTRKHEMEEAIQKGEFLEHTQAHGHYYGTSISAVESVMQKGYTCLLEIDIQGATCVKKSALSEECTLVFVVPPSIEELKERLREQGEPEEQIFQRMEVMRHQLTLIDNETDFWDVVITNDGTDASYAEFRKFLEQRFVHPIPDHVPRGQKIPPPDPGNPSKLEVRASASEVATICKGRAGTVLRQQSILKCDHFPSSRHRGLEEQLRGTPNFREVQGVPVFGAAQPTIPGIIETLERVRASFRATGSSEENPERILWINCREEPVLYVNGRPYCVKDRNNPFGSKANGDVEGNHLIEAERILKSEVRAEAAQYGGRVLLHSEKLPDTVEMVAWGEVYGYWEPLADLLCVHEVYGNLQRRFPELRFMRLPISDSHNTLAKTIDTLIDWLKNAKASWSVICNCQMGRGRTTTAMILVSLLRPYIEQTFDSGRVRFEGCPSSRETARRPVGGDHQHPLAAELVAQLDDGEAAKKMADDCIERCGHMQNFKEILSEPAAPRRASQAREAACALERYLYTVLFAAYLVSQKGRPLPSFAQTFQSFMQMQHDMFRVYDLLDNVPLMTL